MVAHAYNPSITEVKTRMSGVNLANIANLQPTEFYETLTLNSKGMAGEMAQCYRALATLSEDRGSVPSTHIG